MEAKATDATESGYYTSAVVSPMFVVKGSGGSREYHLLGWKKRKTIKEINPRKLAEVLPTRESGGSRELAT